MRASATATAAGVLAACCVTAAALASACPAGFSLRAGNLSTALATGGGVWAACEDLQSGTIAFVRDQGKPLALRKRLAANWVDDAAAYLNFTKESVLVAPGDLLGASLLSRPGGFSLDDVAAAVPPIGTGV